MNDLHTAYAVLGLEPGSSLEEITKRYKRLVIVWHPDRFHTDVGKQEAEAELTRINSARDLLNEHFGKGGHNATGPCVCRSEVGQPPPKQQSAGGPGGGSTEQSQPEAEAARKRDADARRRAQEASAQKARNEAKAAHEQKMQNAFRKEDPRKNELLRWQISVCCAAMFGLMMSSLIGSSGMDSPSASGTDALAGPADSDLSDELSREWKSYQSDKAQVAYTLMRREPTVVEIAQWRPPFVSNDRGVDRLSSLAYDQFEVRAQEQRKQSDQDLTSAKMDVERYTKAIEFSRKRLAELAVQLADPGISEIDRQFAASEQSRLQKFLQESQNNLQLVRKRLSELQGGGSGNDVTAQKTGPAPVAQAESLSIGTINMDPVIQTDGSIKLHNR